MGSLHFGPIKMVGSLGSRRTPEPLSEEKVSEWYTIFTLAFQARLGL